MPEPYLEEIFQYPSAEQKKIRELEETKWTKEYHMKQLWLLPKHFLYCYSYVCSDKSIHSIPSRSKTKPYDSKILATLLILKRANWYWNNHLIIHQKDLVLAWWLGFEKEYPIRKEENWNLPKTNVKHSMYKNYRWCDAEQKNGYRENLNLNKNTKRIETKYFCDCLAASLKFAYNYNLEIEARDVAEQTTIGPEDKLLGVLSQAYKNFISTLRLKDADILVSMRAEDDKYNSYLWWDRIKFICEKKHNLIDKELHSSKIIVS